MRSTRWQETCETGIEAVDYEHRRLGEAIDATCASLRAKPAPDAVLEELGLLYERASAHCAMEDRLLCTSGGATQPRHPAPEHGLLDNIARMMDSYYEGSCETCDKTLEACLRAWFDQHLQGEHREMAAQAAGRLTS